MWPFRRETKDNPVGGAFLLGAGPAWSPAQNRKQYITEGYQLNAVVYRAVAEITSAAKQVKIELHQGDTILEKHPVLDLLARPNPRQAWEAFLEELLVDRMILGEQACIGVSAPQFVEIWPVRPTDILVEPGSKGLPLAYVHDVNGRKTRFPVDQITGQSDLFFAKMHNPLDYWRGQAPMMAAALGGDIHNAGMQWNFSLLKNSARPSGLIKFTGSPSGEVVSRLREFFKKRFTGPHAAGEIPMLTDGAEWVKMDQSAKDMDFLNSMKEAAKLVASVFGVPLPLIDNDASTFNNLEQAKERLYTDTVLPMMHEVLGELSRWLLPRWDEGLELKMDMDSIPALEGVRQRTFKRAMDAYTAEMLTLDEAREMIGFDPVEGGTERRKPVAPQFPPPEKSDLLARLAYG